MSSDLTEGVCAILFGTGLLILLAPLIRYVSVGWRAKRKDVMDGLSGQARVAYFARFCGRPDLSEDVASKDFELMYGKWYGRRFFAFPGALFAISGAIIVAMIVLTGVDELGYANNPIVNLPRIAMAALAGAYLWVLNDHISRSRRLDFSPADVHWATLRLVIAVPMGYAVTGVVAKDIGPFVAFGLGAFPLSQLLSIIRNIAQKRLGFESSREEGAESILHLQGVDKTIQERLENEDITTVVQLAYCDPVRLVMRSNLTFNVVTDFVNQALAWLYFESAIGQLRRFGLRGAVEITDLVNCYDHDPASSAEAKELHERAAPVIPEIAKLLNQDVGSLLFTLRQISEDPYTEFLCRVWTE